MCMVDEYGDAPTIYIKTHRIARKEHKCGECGRVIYPREQYRHVKARWPDWDKFWTFRTCVHCCVIQDWLSRECNGYLHECVGEDIREHVLNCDPFDQIHGYGSGPARLYVGLSRQWQRFDKTGLMPIPPLPMISAHD